MMIKTAKHIKTFLASVLLLIFVMNVSGLFVQLHHQETHQKTEKIAECSDKVCYHKAHLQTKSDCDCGFLCTLNYFYILPEKPLTEFHVNEYFSYFSSYKIFVSERIILLWQSRAPPVLS